MAITKINNTTYEINNFYRIHINELDKYNDVILSDLITQLAKNKLNFYNSITKRIYGMSTIKSFFTNVLLYEFNLKKDFIEFDREEVKKMLIDMGNKNIFKTRSLYDSYMGIIRTYMIWGYENKLRVEEPIYSKKLNINYIDVLNKDYLRKKIITIQEMKTILQLLRDDMNKGMMLMAMSGIEFDEALNLKKETVENCKDYILDLGDRRLKIDQYTYSFLLNLRYKTFGLRLFCSNVFRNRSLASTDYIIRIIDTKRNKNIPVTKSTASNNLSKDLSNAGYDGTYQDLKTSSMLNDYLDGMSIENLNKKYKLTYDKYDLPSVFKVQLEILQNKRQQKE